MPPEDTLPVRAADISRSAPVQPVPSERPRPCWSRSPESSYAPTPFGAPTETLGNATAAGADGTYCLRWSGQDSYYICRWEAIVPNPLTGRIWLPDGHETAFPATMKIVLSQRWGVSIYLVPAGSSCNAILFQENPLSIWDCTGRTATNVYTTGPCSNVLQGYGGSAVITPNAC